MEIEEKVEKIEKMEIEEKVEKIEKMEENLKIEEKIKIQKNEEKMKIEKIEILEEENINKKIIELIKRLKIDENNIQNTISKFDSIFSKISKIPIFIKEIFDIKKMLIIIKKIIIIKIEEKKIEEKLEKKINFEIEINNILKIENSEIPKKKIFIEILKNSILKKNNFSQKLKNLKIFDFFEKTKNFEKLKKIFFKFEKLLEKNPVISLKNYLF